MMVTTLHRSRPTARMEHLCDTCLRRIGKGETYERQDNVFDGERYTYKNCAHCEAFTSRVLALDTFDYWEEGISSDYLVETMRENYKTIADLRMLTWFMRRWTRRDGSLAAVPTSPASALPVEEGEQ